MVSMPDFLSVVHVLGLALALGSATAKLALLLRCRADTGLVPAFIAVARPITRVLITGMVLVTLSGIGWLLIGYAFTTLLIVKLVLVAAVWVLGPIIDNVAEPSFRKLAPKPGEPASPEFLVVMRRYLLLEVLATGLFYVIVLMWMLL